MRLDKLRRKKMVKIVIILSALVSLALAKVDYTGHQVYRAFPNSVQHKVLKEFGDLHALDIWSDYRSDGDFIDFRVSPELKEKIDVMLARNRITHEIFIEDVEIASKNQMKTAKRGLLGGTKDIYQEYLELHEIYDWIESFAAQHSSLVTLMFGQNALSFEGRQMIAMKISPQQNNNPAFVINCGQHSREWVTPATCMIVADQLISGYGNDPEITQLMDAVDFYLVPVSNPDGYVYTWSDDRMWRKTRRSANTNGCSLMQCAGTDPNRNFDDKWDTPGGSSTQCCSDLYRGTVPFSELETQHQRDMVASIPNVQAYIDVHAYSQYWMYPWGWTEALTPDDDILSQIGKDSVAAIRAVNGKIFRTGTIANVIYVSTGSSADYFYDVMGVKCSFAAELRDTGAYGFLLPADQIEPAAMEGFAGLKVIAQAVASGKCQ